MGETASLSSATEERSTEDDEYSTAERYCDSDRLRVRALSRDPRDLPTREDVTVTCDGGGVSSPPESGDEKADSSSDDETDAVLVLVLFVWLGLSELKLLPERTDKSTGDSCWPKSGDQLSVESEELRLSETIKGGGRRCSNRLICWWWWWWPCPALPPFPLTD